MGKQTESFTGKEMEESCEIHCDEHGCYKVKPQLSIAEINITDNGYGLTRLNLEQEQTQNS